MTGISIYGRASKILKVTVRGYTRMATRTRNLRTGKPLKRPVRHKVQVSGHTRFRDTKPRQTRFSFYGTPAEVKQARNKMLAEGRIPKQQFEDQIQAKDFLSSPDDYSESGVWVETPEEDETP